MAVFTVINHTELSVAAATYNVTGIPTDGTYDHLYLIVSARGALGGGNPAEYVDVQFNADTGTNYWSRNLSFWDTTPSTVSTDGVDGLASLITINADGTGSTADTYGNASIWIPNYANTSNFKQAIGRSTQESLSITDGEWWLIASGGLWKDTSAIDEITLDPQNGDFMAYSSFTLYGVKGA